MMVEIEDRTPNRFNVNTTSPAFFSKTNIVFDTSIAATLTRLSQQGKIWPHLNLRNSVQCNDLFIILG